MPSISTTVQRAGEAVLRVDLGSETRMLIKPGEVGHICGPGASESRQETEAGGNPGAHGPGVHTGPTPKMGAYLETRRKVWSNA